jgi:type II secretory pathway pseudopilin PulG
MQFSSSHSRHDPESGYVLLAVIFLTVVLLISLAIAAPKIATEIQRDKDLETIHRGEQYRRAIQLYYRQFGAYPASIDQLVSTNNVRFLRKRYTDPETGKDDWKPVPFGQAHVRPLGFFGQPLATTISGMYALAPATTTDANGFPVSDNGNAAGAGTTGSGAFDSSGFGSGSGMSGANNGTFSMGGQNNSGFGSSSGFGMNSNPGTNGQANSGTPTGGMASGFGASASGFGSNSNGSSTTTIGGSGPIVGFTLALDKPSLVDYKGQTRYNKWEFNYDPIADQMQQSGGLMGGGTTGTGLGGTTGSPGGTNPGTGGTSNGGEFIGPNGNLGNPINQNNQNSNPNGPGGTNTPQP